MRELRYDVIPHHNGYAIVITPEHADAFEAKHDAFDAAVDLARKLRFVGISVHVRVDHADEVGPFARAKAS
jgi:hypothetical protein